MSDAAWTDDTVAAIAAAVSERSGLVFPAARIPAIETGIRRAAARAAFDEMTGYRDALVAGRVSFDDLVAEVTVGETYFFRDPAQLDVLERVVLPEIRRRQDADQTVRVWSAGCASGEEAYSLAIILKEAGLAARARITATDISPVALAKARRAIYGPWSLRGEGAERALPYLVPVGGELALVADVRRMVTLAHHNLMAGSGAALLLGIHAVDLVVCRNVLIYMGPAAVRHVAEQLFASLNEGGWLVLAPSDPPLAELAPFEVVPSTAGMLYRRPLAVGRTCATAPAAPVPPFVRAAPLVVAAPTGVAPALDAAPVGPAPTVADVRRLAADAPDEAVLHCAAAVAADPLSPELRYLWALLLRDTGRDVAALAEMRHALYLDRSLAVAHYALAAMLEGCGDAAAAWRSYRNARNLCDARPADEPVALGDGANAATLALAAGAAMERLRPSRIEPLMTEHA
jgi:chemotaxis protein methyltransferase CheR